MKYVPLVPDDDLEEGAKKVVKVCVCVCVCVCVFHEGGCPNEDILFRHMQCDRDKQTDRQTERETERKKGGVGGSFVRARALERETVRERALERDTGE